MAAQTSLVLRSGLSARSCSLNVVRIPLTSFIAYVNIFDLPRRAQGTEYAGTAGHVALDGLVGCLELEVS